MLIAFIIILLILVVCSLIAAVILKEKSGFLWKIWSWTLYSSPRAPHNTETPKGFDISIDIGTGTVKLSIDVDITKLLKSDRDFINSIIDKMQERQEKSKK